MWWAGKELRRGKKLQEFVGKNEKTKLVVKISKVQTVPAEVETRELRQDLLSVTVESISAFFPERTGGASERASDHRRAAAADDDALPQEAGRAQGEEKARPADEELRHHLPFALGAAS